MASRKSKMEYLTDFYKIFGDKYEFGDFPEKYNQKTKISVLCKKHQKYFDASLNNLMNGHGCPICGKEEMVKSKGLLNQVKYKDKIFENYGNIYNLDNINYNCNYDKDKVSVTCLRCGKESFKTIADLVNHRAGCPFCRKNNMNESYYKNLRELQLKKFLSIGKKVFKNNYSYEKVNYINIDTPVTIHCNIHNYDFEKRPSKFMYDFSGCPICAATSKYSSSFERAVASYLDDKNIKFIPQYRISNDDYLKNKAYDFYLPDTSLLIEIDGEQHRRPAFGRTIDDVKQQKEIDRNKIILAEKYGLKVIRINTDYDVIDVLDGYLNNKLNDYLNEAVESSDSIHKH